MAATYLPLGRPEGPRLAGAADSFYLRLILSATVAALGGILITSKISSGILQWAPFLLRHLQQCFLTFYSSSVVNVRNLSRGASALLRSQGLQLAGVTPCELTTCSLSLPSSWQWASALIAARCGGERR